MAEILISKHRNGALGEVRLRFVGEFSKFTDADNTTFSDLAMDFNAPAANIITRPSRMNDDTKEDIPF
jgi:replicative DNA helicase